MSVRSKTFFMKLFITLFALSVSLISSAQLSVNGSTGTIAVAINAPGKVVDDALTVTAGATIPQFRVFISSNLRTGDVLSYTGALPSGVTASYNATTGVLNFVGSASGTDYQALLRTVRFSTSSTSTVTRTVRFEAGAGTMLEYNGHYYTYITGPFTWVNAKADAAARNFFGLQGYLATITTSGENTFINTNLGKGWIGASDQYAQINSVTGNTYTSQTATEGRWYWITGPEAGTQFSNGSSSVSGRFVYWSGSNPDNYLSSEHYAENDFSGNGRWNDNSGTATLGYILEFGGLPATTLDLYHTRDINIMAIEIQTGNSFLPYTLNDPAITVDNTITLVSTSAITQARVTISRNFRAGDVLSYTTGLPGSFTGSYNASTGVLTFSSPSATVANWQALLRTIKFNSSSAFNVDRTISFSVGNLIAGRNGHFYEYVAVAERWNDARDEAEDRAYFGMEGYLATITSQEENDLLYQTFNQDGWIGASDAGNEGRWYWVTGPEDGTQMTTANAPNSTSVPPAYMGAYNNWILGEPSNSAGNTDYAFLVSSGGNNGRWDESRQNTDRGYFVEYGGLSSDPLMVLSANRTVSISTILATTGLSFQISKVSAGTQLKWSTATERNTRQFDVLHSTDGKRFTKIAVVNAAGNSNERKSYSWLHETPANGVNFYRLEQVDLQGKTYYSEIRQVNSNESGITLWPNPTHAAITISYPFSGTSMPLTIFNMEGRIVYSGRITGYQTPVNVEQFAAGIYIAEIRDGVNSQRIRFIKR